MVANGSTRKSAIARAHIGSGRGHAAAEHPCWARPPDASAANGSGFTSSLISTRSMSTVIASVAIVDLAGERQSDDGVEHLGAGLHGRRQDSPRRLGDVVDHRRAIEGRRHVGAGAAKDDADPSVLATFVAPGRPEVEVAGRSRSTGHAQRR